MAKGSLNFFELHVEKIVLGMAGACALGMLGYYVFLSPNRVEYDGRSVGPSELSSAVLASAEDLDRRIRSAQPRASAIPQYADQLARQLRTSTLGTVGLPIVLRPIVAFGTPLPALTGEDEARDLTLVTPLKPTGLKLRTGRSVVRMVTASLDDKPATTPPGRPPTDRLAGEGAPEAEVAWVTIGSYFTLDAQQTEMTKAGYESHRSKPYISGIDVQRQEVLASGETSDWRDVTPSKAMPQPAIPQPLFDTRTSEFMNRTEVDQAFIRIKDSQQHLLQPPYFPVVAGDPWMLPPLEGYEDDDFSDDDEPRPSPPPPRPTGRSGEGEGPPVASGGTGSEPRTDDPRTPRGGAGGRDRARELAQQRREIRKSLSDAQEALRNRRYDEAIRLAEPVRSSEAATRRQKTDAEGITLRAQEALGRIDFISTLATSGPISRPDHPNDLALWFHDDSVEPGKTYRYRMRVRLWNRYVGRFGAVKVADMARQTELVGEWSLPSEPIRVAPSAYFFVTGAGLGGEGQARVDVFKWNRGVWLKRNYSVGVGETIGRAEGRGEDAFDFSTGVVVLDVRTDSNVKYRVLTGKQGEFMYRELPQSVTVVYIDPADGQVKEKTVAQDRGDPEYTRLKREARG